MPTDRSRRLLIRWFVVFAVAIIVALAVRLFAFQVFEVPSGSMLPTLQVGDRLVVDKLPGIAHAIRRGDIIVFHQVPADTEAGTPILVKRVIGLPGETISSNGDTVDIDGHPIKEPWLSGMKSTTGCFEAGFNIPVTHIPANEYYVMGDCRAISYDSRYWGPVPVSNVIGRVFLVVWRHNHPWFHWF